MRNEQVKRELTEQGVEGIGDQEFQTGSTLLDPCRVRENDIHFRFGGAVDNNGVLIKPLTGLV